MTSSLTEQEVEKYHHDGVLFPLPVLDRATADTCLDEVNRLEQALGGRPRPTELSQMHLHFDWAYRLVSHPRVLDAVEGVLGPDIIVWSAGLFNKHPHDSSYVSWHQDGTYWELDSTKVTTAWIALSASNPANGCMRVVPGSHRQGIHPHEDTYAEANALSRGQEVQVAVDESTVTDVVLQPGEMSLHDVRIIHGSNANTSDFKRVGYVIRYVAPEVRQIGNKPTAVLVRGEDRFGHYRLAGPPVNRPFEEAVRAMQESAREQYQSVMRDAEPRGDSA